MVIQHLTLSINSKESPIVTFIHYIAVLCFFGDILCVTKNRQVKNVVDPGIKLVTIHSPYGRSNQLG